MSWRVARSLDTLLAQINQAFPNRSKASDGSIGDEDHQNRNSDHNPWVDGWIVTARDFTHDPAAGLDIDHFTDELVASRDRRIKYVIANRQICSGPAGPSPWVWRKYNGSNPHTHHFHLSVVQYADRYDDPSLWRLPSLTGSAPAIPSADPAPKPTDGATLRRGSEGPEVRELQRVLNSWYPWLDLVVDGDFGPATEAAVKELQRRAGLVVDGIVGNRTRAVLHL